MSKFYIGGISAIFQWFEISNVHIVFVDFRWNWTSLLILCLKIQGELFLSITGREYGWASAVHRGLSAMECFRLYLHFLSFLHLLPCFHAGLSFLDYSNLSSVLQEPLLWVPACILTFGLEAFPCILEVHFEESIVSPDQRALWINVDKAFPVP